MAVDSIIARPTNKVRVMVAEASGCWANELSANATAFPSASAGPKQPKPMVMPAMTIDATAIIVKLSIISPLVLEVYLSIICLRFKLGLADPCGSCNVNPRQDAEYIGLHHTGEQTERRHDNRKDQGCNREQDGDNHRPAHHVAE